MPEIPPDGAANPTPPESFPNYAGRLREMMRAYHAQVNDRVDATLADLEWRWNAPRAALANTIAALEREMRQAQDAGDTLSYAWLAEADRLARLKASVAGDVQAFAEGARQVVGASQTDAISMGSTAAQEALAATVPPGTSFTFGVPPEDVTTELAGALQPGSPLALLFDGFGATAAQFAQQALFTSVALGESPHVAAQRLEWATNMSRQRAEVIARTETLRAWRGAQMANYRANNDVVQQWMWACDFGPRSCGACIAMDGTYHSLDEELDDHICGRCSALPVTLPWSQILSDAGVPQDTIDGLNLTETSLSAQGGQTASDWFATQAPELQNSILGPAKAEAYRQGDLRLSDLINYAYSPEWGWSLAESSMADLGLDPQQYLADWRAAQAETPPTPERQRQVVARALSEWEQQRAAQIAQAEVRDAAAQAEAQAARPTEWEQQRQAMIDGQTQQGEQMSQQAQNQAISDVDALAATAYHGPTDAYAQQVAENLAPNIAQYAAMHPEMTLEEYKAAVSERLQQLVSADGNVAAVRVPQEVLGSILDDGRLKSSHEVSNKGIFDAAGNNIYNTARVKFEEQAFGYTADAAAEQRPISGYLTDPGADNTFAMSYGEARLVLSDEARQRATVTFGDSLDYGEGRPSMTPRPLADLAWDAYHYPASANPADEWGVDNLAAYQENLRAHDPLNWQTIGDYSHANGQFSDSYLEMQFHGGVSVKDIQEIQFNGRTPPSAEVTTRLDQLGISWSYDPESNPWK